MSAANPIHGEGISLADMGIDSADVGLRPSEVARRYAGKEAVEMYETDEPRPSFDGREERQADIFSSFVNLTNSIIGSGMLGLPFAFAASGWFLGFFFITIAGVATVLSLHLLSLCSLKVKSPASFYRIAEATIPKWAFMIDLSVASMCFGISSSYLIVIGTLMPQVIDFFGGSGFIAERYLWVTIGFCIVGPISCLKSLDALKYTSTLAVLIVVFIACLAASFALSSDLAPCGDDATDDQSCVGDFSVVTFDIGTIKALGVFIFGYSCQMNIFPVVNELKNPSIGRFNIVIYMSIGAAFLLYVTVAAGGYGTYGTSVESDLLLSYPNTSLTSVARMLVCFLVSFSYPLLCVPGRNSMMALWLMNDPKGEDGRIPDCSPEVAEFRFKACTAVYLFCSYIVGLAVTDLGVILDLIGATGATTVTFILPGAAYYIMFENEGPAWKRNVAAFFFCFGCFIGPLVLAFVFV